jgi:MoxR-like ATPase
VLDIERIIGVDKWLAVPYNVQTDRENQQVTYDEKGLSTMAKQEMNQKSIPVRPSELVDVVEHVMSVGRPCMIWGPPGIGKSDIIAQIGNRENRPVIDLRLLLMEPTDLKGIPFYDPKTETMKWGKPGELPGEADTELHNAILFLDEINAAPQSVQAAAYQLILNRRVGEYELPEGVSIVAAGNRETDRAVTFRMPSALANRFMHFLAGLGDSQRRQL